MSPQRSRSAIRSDLRCVPRTQLRRGAPTDGELTGARAALDGSAAGATPSRSPSCRGCPDGARLGGGDPRLPLDPGPLQPATEAVNLLTRKVKRRAWFRQPRQLPPAAATRLRRHLADARRRDCEVTHHVWWRRAGRAPRRPGASAEWSSAGPLSHQLERVRSGVCAGAGRSSWHRRSSRRPPAGQLR